MPWKQVVLPAEATRIKSTLSLEARQYLTWLTSARYEGWGAIVELGTWLGGGTAALAEGLRIRGRAEKIQTYDRFEWEPYMAALAASDLAPGGDFLACTLREISDYLPWADVHRADLCESDWAGGAIEILVVDVLGGWELANAVLKTFGPFLIPGRSRVVLASFRSPHDYCLPLIFDSRPGVWQQTEALDADQLVTFIPLKSLFGPAGIDTDYSEASFPLATAETLLRNRMARESEADRPKLLQMLYRKRLIDGSLDDAMEIRRQLLDAGIPESDLSSTEDVESILMVRGWEALTDGNPQGALDCAARCLSIPGRRSEQALTLLAFAHLRMGDRSAAEQAIAEAESLRPGAHQAQLFRAEVLLTEQRNAEAKTVALEALFNPAAGEAAIEWGLNLLVLAWDRLHEHDARLATLQSLAELRQGSPSFLAHLARELDLSNREAEARATVKRALALAPGHRLANTVWKHLEPMGMRS
ncbi:MAG TPA: hypothetical protein VG456_15205 [Candidatus Sulfopaludibacter sp.]|nr:hypothetical protein [Candidatus Sulfopaludibacter sp.]